MSNRAQELETNAKNPMLQYPIHQETNAQVAEDTPQAMRCAKQHGVKIPRGTDVFFGDDVFQNFR